MEYNAVNNNLIYITSVSVALGIVIGNAILNRSRISIYFATVSLFHLLEFISISKFLPRTVNHNLFLIWNNRGSEEYWIIQALSIIEYVLLKNYKTYSFISMLGLSILISGIIMRYLSIKHLGKSFSHYIEVDKNEQDLVIIGIYKWIRHPSYLGFYLYTIGLQLYLNNLLTGMLCVIILKLFFTKRIKFEEHFLIKNYGERYIKYRSQTRSFIP